MTNRTLVAVHTGQKGYLDGIIRRRYNNPNIGCKFVFEWTTWSVGKLSVKIYRIS